MAGGVRDRMVAGAVRLLARGGPQAPTFSTVNVGMIDSSWCTFQVTRATALKYLYRNRGG